MKTIISRLNDYFIADQDEYIPSSDIAWFYGANGGAIVLVVIFTLLNIFS